MSPRSSRRSRSRAAGASPCSRTPAGWGSSVRTHARRPAWSWRRSGPRSRRRSPSFAEAASVANPVDMLGGATAATYAAVVPRVLADPRVDALIVLFAPTSRPPQRRWPSRSRRRRGPRGDKPVLAVIMAAEGIPERCALNRHVASFSYPESAARALGRAAERAEWLRAPQGNAVEPEAIDRDAARSVVDRALAGGEDAWLAPADTRELLLAYGIPLSPSASRPKPRGGPRRRGARLPGRRQERRSRRPQDGVGRNRARSARRGRREGGGRADRGAVLVQPMIQGGAELLAGVVIPCSARSSRSAREASSPS